MARIDTLANFLTDIATAIKNKKSDSTPIKASDFDTEITNLSGGGKYAPRHISFYGYPGTDLDEEINNLDSSKITRFRNCFGYCSSLKSIPLMDTSNGTDFASMFYNCAMMNTIPPINTSNGTTFYAMFYTCSNLESIPLIDTSNGTDFASMFYNCNKLVSIPQLNTSKATTFNQLFSGCRVLAEVPQIDASYIFNVTNMFRNCTALTNLGGLKNLGEAYSTTISANYSNYKLDLSPCTLLTHDSLMNIINNLYDIKTKGCNNQSLVLGATNLAKLTAEEIAMATDKGWNVS